MKFYDPKLQVPPLILWPLGDLYRSLNQGGPKGQHCKFLRSAKPFNPKKGLSDALKMLKQLIKVIQLLDGNHKPMIGFLAGQNWKFSKTVAQCNHYPSCTIHVSSIALLW